MLVVVLEFPSARQFIAYKKNKMKNNNITNRELKEKFPELSSYINFYYPIGITKDNPIYNKYVGIIDLKSIIDYNILDNDVFKSKWVEGFFIDLENELGYTIIGVTNGLVPNVGGFIRVFQSDDLRMEHQLHFYFSFINDYFSIQLAILDRFKKLDDGSVGWGIDKLVVSPVEGYHKNLFLKVEKYIKKRFPEAKNSPYSIDTTRLNGLEVIHSDEQNCEIGQAFFSKVLPLEKPEKIIGDTNYEIGQIK